MRKSFPVFILGWAIMLTCALVFSLDIQHKNPACHVSQDDGIGDVRGIGIHTAAYHNDYLAQSETSSNKIIIIHGIIFLAGLFLIWYFWSTSNRYRSAMETKNKELRETNEAKDKFFSIIAHDLKTPAANIKFLSETLKENYATLSSDEQLDYINMLVESAKTYHHLLDDLLDLSRLRTGKIQCEAERLDVHALVDEVLDQTRLQAQQKQIVQVNQVEACFAKADRGMIATVVRNIVVNAIKFTHPGGQIVVAAKYVREDVTVSVADTGIGISQDMAGRIFEMSHNKSTAGTANELGTGLGLMVCKEFIEHNHGKIWFESEVGNGTTFFFTVPASR